MGLKDPLFAIDFLLAIKKNALSDRALCVTQTKSKAYLRGRTG